MADVYENLRRQGITLPPPKKDGRYFDRIVPFGETLLYTSGFSPNMPGEPNLSGRIGKEYTVGQGAHFASNVICNILSAVEAEIGDLNKIRRFIKMLCFIAGAEDFTQQAAVADGASDLLIRLFGERAGKPARSAIGVAVLPHNSPVEIELLLELKH